MDDELEDDEPEDREAVNADEQDEPDLRPEDEEFEDREAADAENDDAPEPQADDDGAEDRETETANAADEDGAQAGNQAEQPDLSELRRKALDGDRDAALDLARHHDGSGEPERAADYALIVLDNAGADYAAHFITDTKAWSKPFWSALQAHLKDEKMYGGAIDGLPGRGTKSAVQQYAGVQVAAQPVATNTPKRGTKQPSQVKPQIRQAKPKRPPSGGGKPPPNKWCKIDPNWARCTNQ
jgi:hypothetical protein